MTREEIIQAISDDKMMPFIQPEQLAGIVDFVIKNCQTSLPSDLDEAAEKYANREYPNEPSCGQWGTGDYEPPVDMEYPREIAKDSFKAGAEWQRAKMMEEGYDAFVSADRTIPVLPMKDVSGLGLNYGDKVRVIVIKEDEL